MKFYLVGGAVRDKLLKLPVKDRDWVVVGATQQEMLDAGYKQVGKDFPVFLHPETKEEYALARTERKTAKGYHGFEFDTDTSVTLEQDLARRDLTINAIAESRSGHLIDPFNGYDDLQNGLLRHVSSAFAEDPVRILRVARFAARYAHWGFRVAHGTNALMRKMVNQGEVDALVAERVWAETVKALSETTPVRFFQVLHGCGALEKVFPEIEHQYALTGKPESSHASIDVPALSALENASHATADPLLRFAALCSQLGNEGTDGPARRDIINTLCARLSTPKEYKELALTTIALLERCHIARSGTAEPIVDALKFVDALRKPQRFKQAIQVCTLVQPDCPSQPWEQALSACLSIDTAAFKDSNLSGPQIAEEIRNLQINAVSKSLTQSV